MSSHRRIRGSLAVLAIVLFAVTSMVAAWHTESTHSECPVCQIAHLPLIKPAEVVQPAPLRIVERQAILAESIQERDALLALGPPRGPPAV